MIEMNQNINQLFSKLFRGDFRTKKHCCKGNNMKLMMAKLIAESGCRWTNLITECEKLSNRIK